MDIHLFSQMTLWTKFCW